MSSVFELRKIEENKRGEKCFISTLSGVLFNGFFNIEKYVSVKKNFNHFTLEVFSSNFDLTEIKGKRSKNFYLGDNDYSSYYLLSFVALQAEPKIKKMGEVVFVNEKSYLPLSLAYDLCPDQRSRKLIEAISKINV